MKLKRILSLALSGVLAVSMLTACGGFGGGSGNRVQDASSAFRTVLNSRLDYDLDQATVNFDGRSSDLAKATRAVADVVKVSDVQGALNKTTGAVVQTGDSLYPFATRYIEFDHWTTDFSSYTPTGDFNRDMTFGTVILYDGAMSVDGVGRAVADEVAKWDLAAIDSKSFTYKGHAVAYKVTIPGETSGEGEDAKTEPDTTVWVVGLMLEQTKVQA